MALRLSNVATLPATRTRAVREVVYLGTGVSQHAFVSCDRRRGRLVYKIPASFGYLRPLAEFLRESPTLVKRTRLSSAAIMSVLDRAPVGGRLLAAFLRRKRAQEFAAMLDVLDHATRTGARGALLPCRMCRNLELVLLLGDLKVAYRGPVLIQARATFLRADSSPLACDWRSAIAERSGSWARSVIRAQHDLWRHGIGIADPTEILGPSEWALWCGQIRLGDTGNLRRSFDLVHAALDERALDRRVDEVVTLADGSWAASALEYFRLIRREINQRRLLELWGTAYRSRC
jgi:hypothetical protein